jgi:hypothetical protein
MKIVEKSLLVRRKMTENDIQLQNYVDELVKSKMARGLVKMMKPMDMAGVMAKKLDLCPKDAAKVTIDLIKRTEGLSGGNIETNKPYPVHPQHKKDPPLFDPEEDFEENALARPGTKFTFVPGPPTIDRHHFPPDEESEVEDWPYDDMTTVAMKPSNKSRKRPLNMSKDKGGVKKFIFKEKGPLDTDLRQPQPGGDGAGGGGIYQRSMHSRDNSMSTAGNSTWSKTGSPGWSMSPDGKEYRLPDDTKESFGDEELNFEKNPPVGMPEPTFGYGGRIDGKVTGPRKGFRRR